MDSGCPCNPIQCCKVHTIADAQPRIEGLDFHFPTHKLQTLHSALISQPGNYTVEQGYLDQEFKKNCRLVPTELQGRIKQCYFGI